MQIKTRKAPQQGAFLVFLSSVFFAASVGAECSPPHIDEYGKVVHVYDGDTVQISDGRKIRLIGIDTPEIAHPGVITNEPYADEAKRELINAIGNDRRIGIEYDAEQSDKYHRTLAYVYNEAGEDLAARQVRRGLATVLVIPPNTRRAECYNAEERVARELRRGLWTLVEKRLTPASQLSQSDTGYKMVSGNVTRIREKSTSIWLTMDDTLSIVIQKADVQYFQGVDLTTLQNRKLIVRGNIVKRSQRLMMQLRHGYAMELAQ